MVASGAGQWGSDARKWGETKGDSDVVVAAPPDPGGPGHLRACTRDRARSRRGTGLRPVESVRRSVPDRPLHGRGREAAHGRAREPAQAQLCRPPVGLPRHRRAQHTRRLQPPAAALDPLHGRDRRGERLERERLPRSALRRRRDRDQPDRLGASCEHAPRRVGSAARPAHALLARRHERSRGRRRRPDRDLLPPPGSELRSRQGRRRQGLPQGADRGAQSLAPGRRRERGRCHREPLHDAERDDAAGAGAGADQGIDPGSGGLPDRQARRAHSVPALERARCPVHAADAHHPGLHQLIRTDARSRSDPGERRHDRLRLLQLA